VRLTPEEHAAVAAILRARLPGRAVWAFGSRVHGRRLKPFSDLDLAVDGGGPLSLDEPAELKAAFSDSSLPFRVDVLDWARADRRFREEILREHIVLVEPSGRFPDRGRENRMRAGPGGARAPAASVPIAEGASDNRPENQPGEER
jgi:predicted nucleotidyltransferase